MLSVLRSLLKNIPTFILALALASAVWISAVTSADPNEQLPYNQPVNVEIIGQDPGLILTSSVPAQVFVTIKAPKSVWDRIDTLSNPITAVIDLSNLAAGTHIVTIQVNVTDATLRPIEIVTKSPDTVKVILETLASRSNPIHLIVTGDPSVGYQAGQAALSQNSITISGPESLVNRVTEIRASINISQIQESLRQTVSLIALDVNGNNITGITLTPDNVVVSIPVTQRGGYRNVVIKVITTGQIASGYRLTNISAFPPSVTIFSSDPQIIENLPGYVETKPIDIEGVKEDLDVQASLNLPDNVSVVGNQGVTVQVGVAAIEGSLTLSNMHVEVIGLAPDLSADLSPDRVDVILSGPLFLLDQLSNSQVHVTIDLTNQTGPGVIKVAPKVVVDIPDIQAESVLPGTVEINIIEITQTPTPTITPTSKPSATLKPGTTLRPTMTPTITPTPPPTPTP